MPGSKLIVRILAANRAEDQQVLAGPWSREGYYACPIAGTDDHVEIQVVTVVKINYSLSHLNVFVSDKTYDPVVQTFLFKDSDSNGIIVQSRILLANPLP